MKVFLKTSSFIFIFFLTFTHVIAASVRISGKVTEENGEPVPFASVYIEGSSRGTTTNIEGNYNLELEPGSYNIVFRFIGFKQRTEQVLLVNSAITLNVILSAESYQLKEVRIIAGAEDPAYAIIRQAQKKRKDYVREVEEFKNIAYVKSTQLLESYPKKIMGQEVDMGEFIDTVSKIFYLSESVSNFSFKQTDKVKEEMISSTLSGDPKGYSFNKASDLLLNFYNNLIQIGGLTPRGLVSPISASALVYYDYRLEGTFVENGETVNKIKVIPKRKSDPVFQGDIFILDDSWRIHSFDLLITRAQQIQFLDTFRIVQSFLPVDKERWLLFNTQYAYHFNVLGFVGSGKVLGIFSEYQLDPGFPAGYFDGQVMKVNKESNTRDSSYWEQVRPVPLTVEEKVDYKHKDSTRVVFESKEYMDSMDAKSNKFRFNDLFLNGYSYSNSFENKSFSVTSLLENLQFNSVEGFNTSVGLTYRKQWEESGLRSLRISPSLRYGFSNTHFNAKLEGEYRYNPKRNSILKVEGGSDVVQFNPENPINALVNSMYSLLARKNYMKVYEKRYGRLEHRSELFNGLRLGLAAEFADRLPLRNSTSYAIASTGDRKYTTNIPWMAEYPELNALADEPWFLERYEVPRNQSFTLEADLRIRIRQKYIDRPEGKYIIGSKYPELGITYKKAIKILDADAEYDLISTTISDDLRLGLLGKLHYLIGAGRFLEFNEDMYFMDLHHFNGNKTWFTNFKLDQFRNLDYYKESSLGNYLEMHAEHHFGGFLLNKIPYIRKLKLTEFAGMHYLYTDGIEHYTEVSLGIEKLNFIRLEVYTSFVENKMGTVGIVFGIKRSIGGQR